MALRTMLHKHPKTSVYYFRKRIPEGLQRAYGQKTYKRSLRTKDRKAADRLLPQEEARFNEILDEIRSTQGFTLTSPRGLVRAILKDWGYAETEKDVTEEQLLL